MFVCMYEWGFVTFSSCNFGTFAIPFGVNGLIKESWIKRLLNEDKTRKDLRVYMGWIFLKIFFSVLINF